MSIRKFLLTTAALPLLALSLLAPPAALAEPVKDHPRLWIRAADIPALQTRLATPSPMQAAFVSVVQQALADWQNGNVPDLDSGTFTGNGNPYPSELWGMLFSFMSLIETNPTMKQTYVTAAHDCLMFVMDQASAGPGTPDANGNYPPFRHPDFTLADRGFYSEAFALMVDWLQATPGAISAADMGKIRKTFLWWADKAREAVYFSPNNPNDLVNDPSLLHLAPPATQYDIDNRVAVREALNNHYANRLKTDIMTALALDPADDVPVAPGDTRPPGALTGYVQGATENDWIYTNQGYLRSGTGAWLYLTDYGLRHDGGGGGSQEGLEYMSNGLAPVAFALLALQTAGQADAAQWGPQVVMSNHPFWDKALDGYLDVLPPTKRLIKDYEYRGPQFEPAWFGDGENYGQNDQFIKILAPLALHDVYAAGDTNAPRMKAVRYIQSELAQGGPSKIADRILTTYAEKRLRDAIFYFLLFDPAGQSEDPRPSRPDTNFESFNPVGDTAADPVNTMGAIYAHAGQGSNRSMLDWRLSWNRVDHQHADGGGFELWRNGVWLTKRWIGYGAIAGNGDYNNALAVQNDPLPASDTFHFHQTNNRHGSQYCYSADDDPAIVAKSLAKNFLYVSGDSTALYNLYNMPAVHDVEHVSRSLVWVKPDFVFVYDRARTGHSDRFKRFYLALTQIPQITGNVAKVTAVDDHEVSGVLTQTPKADFYTTTLLPAGATPTYDLWRQVTGTCALPGGATVDCDSEQAPGCVGINPSTGKCPNNHASCHCQDQSGAGESAFVRLRVDAPGNPADARFLHVLQGSDVGAAYANATLIQSSAGTSYQGGVAAGTAVLFPTDLDAPFTGVTYDVPASTTGQLVTGLLPTTTYYVTQTPAGGATTVSIATTAGGGATPAVSDSGGVLVLGGVEPADVSIVAADGAAAEAGGDTASFTVSRSGSIGAALSVHYTLSGSATSGSDYASLSGTVTIPAGLASTTLTLTPINDGDFEGVEEAVVTITDDAAYYAAAGVNSASAQIADDDPPPGGFLQFSSAAFSAAENGGVATVTVTRSGASAGTVTALCTTFGGSATVSADYTSTADLLTWGPGDTAAKFCTIPILDDAAYEGDETVGLSLGSVTGQAALGLPSAALLTIVENEPAPPGQLVLDSASYTVAEAGVSVTIKVKRVGGNGGTASVSYATADGSASSVGGADFTAKSGTLTWNAGESQDQSIVIPIAADDAFEGGSETFSLSLSGATIPLGAPSSATVTITDDDPQPVEFDVGPGWPFPSLGDVPWQALAAGSTVRIHWKATPYFEKFLVSSRGTVADPIRIVGIAGPGGARPVIDGTNATSSGALHFVSGLFTETHSVVAVARDAQDSAVFKPGYIDIEGLEIRGATGSFTGTDSAPKTYSGLGGAVLIQGAEHVTVKDCVVHDSANGIVVESLGAEADVARDITIQGNHLYANGWAGQYNGRNMQVGAVGVLVERNRMDAPVNGGNGYNVEDRSAGLVLRYNWIEGGGNLLHLGETQSAVIRADAAYSEAFVYGNVLLDGPNDPGTLVFYGGNSGDTAKYRKGTLYFFHNTAILDSTAYEPSVFGLATDDEHVDARNNVLYRNPVGVSFGSAPLRLMPSAGHVLVSGSWITAGTQVGSAGVVIDNASVVTGTAPGFANYGAGDFALVDGGAATDIGVALLAETSAHPVTRQYVKHLLTQLRPVDAPADAGAFEFGTVPAECGNAIVEVGEDCDGGDCCSGACTFQAAGSVCRGAVSLCDAAETCSGASPSCPVDAPASAGVPCRPAIGVCDLAEVCDGSAFSCPVDAVAAAAVPCRAAAGDCDVAEACDGTSPSCPADALAGSGVLCRGAAGLCDAAEHCSGGSPLCPGDAKLTTSCRGSSGVCDPGEVCDGASNDCPADAKSISECRGATGACDVAEWCDGASSDCPADLSAADGTPCDDGFGCPLADTCMGGQCSNQLCLKPDTCQSGIAIEKGRLRLKASPFLLRGMGEALIEKPWIAVDPATIGIRLVLDSVLDADIPGGAQWKVNAAGTKWVYKDASGSVAGITQVVLTDLSRLEEGRIRWRVKGAGPDRVLPAADAVSMSMMLGDYDECAALTFNDGDGPRPNCRGDLAQLKCR